MLRTDPILGNTIDFMSIITKPDVQCLFPVGSTQKDKIFQFYG